MSNVNTQFRRWVFTWNMPEYTGSGPYPVSSDLLQKLLIAMSCKDFNYQIEIGAKAGVYHYQGRFSLSEKMVKSKLLQRFNAVNVITHLTIQPECSKLQSEAYCNKEETRVFGTEVWFPTRYTGNDLPRPYVGRDTTYFWQEQLDAIIFSNTQRKITILMDTVGGMGKSTYIKSNCFRNPSDHYLVTVLGTAISINASLIAVGPRKVYHIDLNRSYPKSSLPDLFLVLESLKNGMLSSSMYGKPQTLFMDVPTIIVYTNMQFYVEDLAHLSQDRWDFRVPMKTHSGTGQPTVSIVPLPIGALPSRQRE